jgi:hypothetical protein
MVGGGQFTDFVHPDTLALRADAAATLDAELFVRYAQAAALFPMVQFSLAPWRVLNEAHLAHVVAAAKLHERLAPEILRLADHAAATGEPLLRHVAFVCPEMAGAERIADQFMLGDDVLVAPVLRKGARARSVALPPGAWAPQGGARGWVRLRRGGAAVADALAAAEAAGVDAAADACCDDEDGDDDADGCADAGGGDVGAAADDEAAAVGTPVVGPALVRVAAVDEARGGALRPLPWFARVSSCRRLGLAATAAGDAPVEDGPAPPATPHTA